jgi:probable addiction module antidote protein
MTEIKIRPFDAANYLETNDDIAEYLTVVREANDQQLLAAALSDVARAKQKAQRKTATTQ